MKNIIIAIVTGRVPSKDGDIKFIENEIESINNAIAGLTMSIIWLIDAETSTLAGFWIYSGDLLWIIMEWQNIHSF